MDECAGVPARQRRLMSDVSYVLPIRSTRPPPDELSDYLGWLSQRVPVIVVDGSEPDVFAANEAAWCASAKHIAPDPALACANGKVHGVLTALGHVATRCAVIADDDVRFDEASLARMIEEMGDADLVIPQNYFRPLPWHARWDTGRTLLNRVTGGDFPGTLGLRVEALRGGGYDGDVLFENLELMRTVTARGGTCRKVPDLFVRRVPPSTRHFLRQRVRQAYDELARPLRLAIWLTFLPAIFVLRRRPASIAVAALAVVAMAEAGRRRHRGRTYFDRSTTLMAPLWVLERAICVWLALGLRCRGGVRYAGRRVKRAANPTRTLRIDRAALT
jgi:hypothetical protein